MTTDPERPRSSAAAAEPNACHCQACFIGGAPCSLLAPDDESICDECSMGIHEWDRIDDD